MQCLKLLQGEDMQLQLQLHHHFHLHLLQWQPNASLGSARGTKQPEIAKAMQ